MGRRREGGYGIGNCGDDVGLLGKCERSFSDGFGPKNRGVLSSPVDIWCWNIKCMIGIE